MAAQDISAERRIAEDLGCAIAAWDPGALVIEYHEPGQRQQLINGLGPLGWLHPVNDPGDVDAMLLDIRRAPAKNALTLEARPWGIYVLTAFSCVFVAIGMYDMNSSLASHNILGALMSGTIFLLITAFVFYSGIEYVTLKVQLTKQGITLTNMIKTIALRADDVKSCDILTNYTFGLPVITIVFTMKNGMVYAIPATFRRFHTLKDELRKRYTFSVSE